MHSKVRLPPASDTYTSPVLTDNQVLIAMFTNHTDTSIMRKRYEDAIGNGKRKAGELDQPKSDVGGWAYVGSHNFTPAAWVRYFLHEMRN